MNLAERKELSLTTAGVCLVTGCSLRGSFAEIQHVLVQDLIISLSTTCLGSGFSYISVGKESLSILPSVRPSVQNLN